MGCFKVFAKHLPKISCQVISQSGASYVAILLLDVAWLLFRQHLVQGADTSSGGPQGFHGGGGQRVQRGPCFAMFFSILAGHAWKTCIYYIVLCTRESPRLKLVFPLSGKQSGTVYLKDLIIQRSSGRSAL